MKNALDYLPSAIKRLVPASLKSRMHSLMGKPSRATRMRQWVVDPDTLPWFDRPNALELLAERRRTEKLDDADCQRLHEWVTNGYCVVPGLVSPAAIDAMIHDLDGLWSAEQAYKGLVIDGLRFAPDKPPVNLNHGEVLALTPPPARHDLCDRAAC